MCAEHRSDSCPGCLLLGLLGGDEVVHDVDRHGEDDGGVVLGSDTAQGLKVPELQLQSGYNIRTAENQIWVTFLLKKRPKDL